MLPTSEKKKIACFLLDHSNRLPNFKTHFFKPGKTYKIVQTKTWSFYSTSPVTVAFFPERSNVKKSEKEKTWKNCICIGERVGKNGFQYRSTQA